MKLRSRFCFGIFLVVLLGSVKSGFAAIVTVNSTQSGLADGSPMFFNASGTGGEGFVAGEFEFVAPVAAFEIPLISLWAIAKSAGVDWAINHLFSVAEIPIGSLITLNSTTTFVTGHEMTATHSYTPVAAGLIDETVSFSVVSPAGPIGSVPDVGISTLVTTHFPNLVAGTTAIETIFYDSTGVEFASSSGVLVGVSPGLFSPSTTTTAIFELFPIGDGTTGTFTTTSVVPVPGAVWLFSSGMLGLFGVARRNL